MSGQIASSRSSIRDPGRETSRVHPSPTPPASGRDSRPPAVTAGVVAAGVVAAGVVAAGPRAGRWRAQRSGIPTSATGGGRYGITKAFRTVGVLSACVLAYGARASGSELSWVPVDAGAQYTTAQPDGAGQDTEIILLASLVPKIVEFEIRLHGWGETAFEPKLLVAQAGVDATGFWGANANPANPGIDLIPLNNQPWRESPGGVGQWDGAFIATMTCHDANMVDTGRVCASAGYNTWDPCPPGTVCFEKDDFVFSSNLAVAAVATAVRNYVWGATSGFNQCASDTGGSYYLGTLALNVPAAAIGTYSFGFDPLRSTTFLNRCEGSRLPYPSLTPGHVTLTPGACCDRSQGTCTERVHPADCAPPMVFHAGVLFCADLPDSDADGLPDCADQCPGIDDAVFAPECVGAIPTTTAWGLAVMALLLLIVGKVYFGRRATIRA